MHTHALKARHLLAATALAFGLAPIGSKVLGSIHRARPASASAGRALGGGFSRTQMTYKIKAAVVGLQFGAEFVPIYRDHPDVSRVAVCDLDPAKLDAGDLVHTVDFRSVYATLLEHHLKAPSAPILGRTFPLLSGS